jgi:hypothetical protein
MALALAGISAGMTAHAAARTAPATRGRHRARRSGAVGLSIAGLLLVALAALPPIARADPSSGAPTLAELGLPKVAAIASEGGHSCLLGEDGSVWCWGSNQFGQLGIGGAEGGWHTTPQRVVGLAGRTVEVVATNSTTCAVTESGAAWCWGRNADGEVGDGTTEDRTSPTLVLGLDGGVSTFSSAGYGTHMCALLNDGSAMCWGANHSGQLGDGTTEGRPRPVRVSVTDEKLVAIVAGQGTTCALTDKGAVRCWGMLWKDPAGTTEEGSTDGRPFVTPLGLASGVTSLSASDDSACALLGNREVRCWSWGWGDAAQAASAPWNPGPVPRAVAGLPDGLAAVEVVRYNWSDAGSDVIRTSIWACATRADRAWCWGDNHFGQLGDGTTTDRVTPTQVQTGDLAQLALGHNSSIALLRDGSLVMWGAGNPAPRSPFAAPVVPATTGFRPPDTLVPAITTHIPTPADISTDPPVVGANLLLAAIAMILFTIATELLNRSLRQADPMLRRRLRPIDRLDRARARLDAALIGRLGNDGHAGRATAMRLLGIAAFYGIVFSLLDPTWNPLTVTGLWLVLIMAVAFGLIGLSGDIAAWATARRWGVASELALKPGSLVTAVGSTLFSRTLLLVPGVMIGSPEVFDVDAARLDRRRLGGLAGVGLGTVLAIGLVAWLATLGTAALRGGGSLAGDLVGGLEAFLLLVFAAAVQNGFAQLLSIRESAGLALRRAHRVVWAFALLGVTFLFWHTLVNPRGDLAEALGATNVQTFLATVGIVLAISVVTWTATTLAQRRAARTTSSAPAPAPDTRSAPDAEVLLVETPSRSAVPVGTQYQEVAIDVRGNVRGADGSCMPPSVAPMAQSRPQLTAPQPSPAAVRSPGVGIDKTPATAPPTSSREPAMLRSRNDASRPCPLRDQVVEEPVDEAQAALAERPGISFDEKKGAQ